MSEMDEAVGHGVELATSLAEREEGRGSASAPAGEKLIALSTAVLASLSVVASLFATFSSDKAADARSQQAILAASRSGASAGYAAMLAKVELLRALGRAPSAQDEAELQGYRREAESLRAEIERQRREQELDESPQHVLTIATGLFQIGILLGSVAVMVRRRSLWGVGLTMAAVGTGFLVRGLWLYLSL
jgi:hypothetical protein